MSKATLLFDLDGTISDPLDGIALSINYTLLQFGFEPRPLNEIARYIGPPIDETITLLTHTQKQDALKEMVEKYREMYGLLGYSQNRLYPGIKENLERLAAKEVCMGICTSKLELFAEQILKLFHIRHFFEFICGGDVGIKKSTQIKELLKKGKITPHTIMIGDRAIDLAAAHDNKLSSAGVLWGYGSKKELEKERPLHLLKSPSQLLSLVE